MLPGTESSAGEGDSLEPFVVASKRAHKQTFIILHGRGDKGDNFGARLLLWEVSGQKGSEPHLQNIFPHAKFIFPTAALRRAEGFNRSKLHQWFDVWKITEQTERESLQFTGLRESTTLIHSLLREEIAAVGKENVVLWGLSQGCAISLIALMLWEGEAIGACIGMCGWLPLRQKMDDLLKEMLEGGEIEQGEDLFMRREGGGSTNRDGMSLKPQAETVKHLADVIDFAPIPEQPSMAFQKVPILLGHGTLDPKVPVALGREAAEFLARMGASVDMTEYDRLGHWYSSDMLRDTVAFLHMKLAITVENEDRAFTCCAIA